MCDEIILRLFNCNTEEDNFSGFSVQQEDEDSDLLHFGIFLTSRVTAVLLSFYCCVTAM